VYVKFLLQELWNALRMAMGQGLSAPPSRRTAGVALTVAAVMVAAAIAYALFGVPRTCRVSGKVVMDDQVVAHGSIVFVPTQTSTAPLAGGQITEGRYSVVKNLAPGEYQVEIRSPRPSKKPMHVSPQHAGMPTMGFEEGVDAKFNAATSLRVVIQQGGNALNFDVNAAPQE